MINKSIFTDNQYLVCKLILFYFLMIFLLPDGGFYADIACWKTWSCYIKSYGFSYAYNSGTNYNPLYQYVLYFFAIVNENVAQIAINIRYLKLTTLVFDLIPIAIIPYFIVKSDPKRLIYPYFLLFNGVYLYNTLLWAQVDAIFTCLVFLSYFLLTEKRPIWAWILFVCALNMKSQAIIFLPPIMLIYLFRNEFNYLKILKIISILILVQLAIIYPFLNTTGFSRLKEIVFAAVDYYPYLSMNAYNIWHLIQNGNPNTVLDSMAPWGISYKNVGLLLFCFFSGIFMIYYFILAIKKQLLKSESLIKFELKSMIDLELLILGTIPVLFFYFNTQMHERYATPCLLFLAIYSFRTQRWLPFILSNIACFLNLDSVLGYFQFNYSTILFLPKTIAVLFLVLILVLIHSYVKTIVALEKI